MDSLDIAIIGLSCRLPGAPDACAFWQNVRDGVESIRFFSEDELIEAGWARDAIRQTGFVPARGYLADSELFDAGFFGFTPREAEITDPQQRVFLECAWEALEDAGCNPETFDGAIGVYAGCSQSTYLLSLFQDPEVRRTIDPYALMLGHDKDYLATRVAYKCNLRGPAVTVQTACSTSLVAVHLACQALLTGECDAALAGGVSICAPAMGGYVYQQGGINAVDGHCRAFDADATGTLSGHGAGIVLLKRLSDAIANRDHIRAIVKGSAINNDGALKVGFTAPSVQAQARCIRMAQKVAHVEPETIGYVEAHGTATALGDPIEVAALTQAFGARTTRRQYCALGSVKTNLGHLDAAAGIAGLIKTVLALEAQCLPPSLHFRRPNPQIAFADSPFHVNTSAAPWPGGPGQPRRAGVSSFGIGGTNAHVVLEEAPLLAAGAGPARAAAIPPAQLLAISARDAAAVQAVCARLADHLAAQPTVSLADVAYTLQVGRKAFPWRVGVVGRTAADVVAPLRAARGVALPERVPPVVFLCPGQGAQYAGLGRRLYAVNRVFRASLDASAATLGTRLGADLRTLLFADDSSALAPTAVTQPALFAVTYALAQVWQAWGVVPQALLGHSVGEYVAACLSGVFDAATALHLVAERGRLMGETPAGAMLAVRAGVETLTPQLAPPLEIAAVNGPMQTVLTGPIDAIAAFGAQWRAAGGACTRLATQHAFHSALMDDAVARFAEVLAGVTFAPPRTPFVSNVSGTWIRDEEATNAAYWARQLRAPVQFMRGVSTICATEPPPLLLEVGPGRRLTRAALDIVRDRAVHAYASLPLDDPDREDDTLLEAAGAVWRCGLDLRWPRVHDDEPRARVALPTYPFQRQRYWRATEVSTSHQVSTTSVSPADAVPAASAASVAPPSAASQPIDARDALALSGLTTIVVELTGFTPADIDIDAPFTNAMDSLTLVQFARVVRERFGAPLEFAQLFDEVPSLRAAAAFIAPHLPASASVMRETAAPVIVADTAPTAPAASSQIVATTEAIAARSASAFPTSALEHVMQTQLQVILTQLDVLKTHGHGASAPPTLPLSSPAPAPPPASAPRVESVASDSSSSASGDPWGRNLNVGTFVSRPAAPDRSAGSLTPEQRASLDAFVAHYTRRTAQSKHLAQAHRPHLADCRGSTGFRRQWKELVYPIVGARSHGSRLWDVDGNEYVDVAMGFGVHLFGHSPDFVLAAIQAQLERGLQLGPQSDLAGRVARQLCDMTGTDRCIFSNSGTEAVMAAMRVARTVTGRRKIAIFSGSYHGWSDLTSAREGLVNGRRTSVPTAPGISENTVNDLIVLRYGEPDALETIKAIGRELAAVLVEPVQSRRPDFQPIAFLHELRALTRDADVALIFDEVISGFRLHPGGAQALFGIKADLATYGKVLGGGLPIGVIAGASRYMDAFDGGQWQFGDDSCPLAEKTYFAGTFCKHPLAMAAADAVLARLQAAGPDLQRQLTQRTTTLLARLNDALRTAAVPVSAVGFGSQFIFTFSPQVTAPDFLSCHLLARGVYVWEGGTCYLSTAHSDEDLDRIVDAVSGSVHELRRSGWLPTVASSRPAPAIAKENRGGPRPAPIRRRLTDFQRTIWLYVQMGDGAATAFNECLALYLRGPLDHRALTASVQSVVQRHESLRTTFEASGESQVVHASIDVPVPIVDLAGNGEATLEDWLAREARDVFDLTCGPLIRFRLLRRSREQHVLVMTVHHMVCDGWSTGAVIRDLRTFYEAHCRGTPPALPEAQPFSKFIEWEDANVSPRPLDTLTSESAGGSTPANAPFWLPADRPLGRIRTHRGGRMTTTIDGPVMARLQEFSAATATTRFAVVLGAFAALMHRLSGEATVTIGIPVAGQSAAGGDYVGCCLRFAMIRSAMAGDALSASEHARAIRRELIAAYERTRRLPSGDLSPSAPQVGSAVFFNLEADSAGIRMHDVELVQLVPVSPSGAKFDLSVNVRASDRALALDWDYDVDQFDASTVERWAASFATVLDAYVSRPAQPVRRVRCLTAAQADTLARDAQGPPLAVEGHSLIDLFDRQVARGPERIAIEHDTEAVTFAQVRQRIDRLADVLREQGVGPTSTVAVCLERSVDLIATCFALDALGAVMVPTDPAHPAQRLAAIADDCRADAVIVARQRADGGVPPRTRQIVLPADRSPLSSPSPSRDVWIDRESRPGWIMYTSGSTGTPKGVVLTRAAMRNRLQWFWNTFPIIGDEICLQRTSPTFVDFFIDAIGPLLQGLPIAIGPSDPSDAASMARVCRASQITRLVTVPSLLQLMLDAVPAGTGAGVGSGTAGRSPLLPHLRYCFVSGEPLPTELARRFAQRWPSARLVNLYGTTEVLDASACEPLAHPSTQRLAPIGTPLANVRTYVVDRALELAPIGTWGEIVVSGDNIALGYLGRPGLTAAAFVPDPWAGRPGARMYRTGDRGRWANGRLEYGGRRDFQIKIRGQRVQPEEIASTLRELPDVAAAIVVASTDTSERPLLHAYVVGRPGADISGDRLRLRLRNMLPDHMLPATVTFLDELPRKSNGKYDYTRLPAHTAAPSSVPVDSRVPLSATARAVAEIWRSVLECDDLSADSDFFAIGGDSLVAVRVLSRLRDRFSVDLTLRDLLTLATLGQLAAEIDTRSVPA